MLKQMIARPTLNVNPARLWITQTAVDPDTQDTIYRVNDKAVMWAGTPKDYACTCGRSNCEHIDAVVSYWHDFGTIWNGGTKANDPIEVEF